MPTTNGIRRQAVAPQKLDTVKCPCCGTVLTGRADPHKIIDHLELGGVRRAVLRTLAANFGRDVPTEVLADRIYSGTKDGGPATALEGIKVHAFQLRKILAPYRLTVTGNSGGTFRLDWADAPAIGGDLGVFG